jgi:hypothetical protein
MSDIADIKADVDAHLWLWHVFRGVVRQLGMRVQRGKGNTGIHSPLLAVWLVNCAFFPPSYVYFVLTLIPTAPKVY